MEHSIAVRHYLRKELNALLGDDTVNNTITVFLPRSSSIESMTKGQHSMRNLSFLVIFAFLAFGGMVLLEMLRCCMNCYIQRRIGPSKSGRCCTHDYVPVAPEDPNDPAYEKMEEADGQEKPQAARADEDGRATEEVEAMRKRVSGYDPQDLFFVAYQHTYTFGCLFLASYAFMNDYLSQDYGLDYELYIPWLLGTIVVHLLCLCYCFTWVLQTSTPFELPSTLSAIPGTIFNPFGSYLGTLRDAVVAGIYAQHSFMADTPSWGPLLLSAVTTLCMFLPNLWIYCNVCPFRDFQDGYWPVVISTDNAYSLRVLRSSEKPDPGRSESQSNMEALQKFVLNRLDAQTRENKQAVAWLGDVPQAIIGFIFLAYYCGAENSIFVLLVTVFATVKSALIIICRPHILCALASFGLPWSHLTKTDVERAVCCTTCTWSCRSRACRSLLKDPHTASHVRVAAVCAIRRLYEDAGAPRDAQELRRMEHSVLWEVAQGDQNTQAVAKRVMKVMSGGSEDSAWLKAAILLRRLRNDDPDEKKQAAMELTTTYKQYAGAYIRDLCSLLTAPSPAYTRPDDITQMNSAPNTFQAYNQTREVREAASRALGQLGLSLQKAETGDQLHEVVSEAMMKAANEVVPSLESDDREVRSAVVSAVTQFRGGAASCAVKHALKMLENPNRHSDVRKVGEIVLVELLPRVDENTKSDGVKRVVRLFFAGDAPLMRQAASNVLFRMGGGAAGAVLEELGRQQEAGGSTLSELQTVLNYQKRAVEEIGGKAAAAEGLNLLLDRSQGLQAAEELLQVLRSGKQEVFEALSARGLAFKIPAPSDERSGILPVFFTDLEPDDIMFIAEMWKYLRKKDTCCCRPLIIFSADLDGKDGGHIFEKKILLAALMLGRADYRVLTPDPAFSTDVPKPKEKHPIAEHVAGLRQSNIKSIQERIVEFTGQEVRFYICSPGRGNLGAIVNGLDLSTRKRSVHLYSGMFNVKGMSDRDLNALYDLVGDEGVLVDAAKFPFFGGNDAHKLTKAFTTFALPSFAPLLSCRHHLIAAVWALINDEFNMKLIHPDKLFETEFQGPSSLRRIRELYEEGKIKDYAQAICNDKHLSEMVVKKKQVTLRAFACDCCDAPLCDQLVFLHEWVKDHQQPRPDAPSGDSSGHGDALKQTWLLTEVGSWIFNKKFTFTSVDTRPGVPGLRAIQPVMRQPHDAEALYRMSEALQEYTLDHLDDLRKLKMSDQDVKNTYIFHKPS